MTHLFAYYGGCAACAALIYYGFGAAVSSNVGWAVRLSQALRDDVEGARANGRSVVSNENARKGNRLAA